MHEEGEHYGSVRGYDSDIITGHHDRCFHYLLYEKLPSKSLPPNLAI